MQIIFKPIGYIKSPYYDIKEIPKQGINSHVMGELILNEELLDGLKGMVSLTHIIILFNFHKSSGFSLLQHPGGDRETEEAGVFSTRSPFRPNGIGMSIVKVLNVSGNTVKFQGVDMLNNTPVLDIKPYSNTLNPPEDCCK